MQHKSVALLLVIVFLTVSCFAAPIPVKAEARTIIVPDDYPTIAAAVGNATDGDTIFVREGTYEGPTNQTIIIDKTLSIVGENAENTIIKLYPAYNVSWILTASFFSYSDAIAIKADGCKLLNLTVVIASPGGYISATGNRTQIIGNKIETGQSTGITATGSYSKITDNVMDGRIQLKGAFSEVARNSLYGIHTMGVFNFIKDNTCQGLSLYNSTNNLFLGNSVSSSSRGYSGIELTNSNNNFFCRNQISGFQHGFRLWFSSSNTIVANTVADSLDASITLGASFNNKICLNNFVDNPWWRRGYVYDYYSDPHYRDAFPSMTASTNLWDNGSLGNYWGDHNGSDVNGDGIGDAPYIIDANNQDHYPLMTRVDINSVPIQLPEWALNLPPEPQETEGAAPSLNPSPEPQDTELQQIEPFPTTLVAVPIASVAIIGAGLVVYFAKIKKHPAKPK